MLHLTDPVTNYGNLMSYKFYIRPAAHAQFGYIAKVKSKHQKNVHHVLRLLFIHGACTTWDMAKIRLNNTNEIREKEREYRRLFVGRNDGVRHTNGILDLGLVIRQEKIIGKKISWIYRLSLHGILYCLDVLEPTKKDIDTMASKYAASLPMIFGRWDVLKSFLGDDVYRLSVLSKALFLDNATTTSDTSNPLHELMTFVHIKYKKHFDLISEQDLAEQIAYWFYTYMRYYIHPKSKKTLSSNGKIKKMFMQDPHLHKWYVKFFKDAKAYYKQRLYTMNSVTSP